MRRIPYFLVAVGAAVATVLGLPLAAHAGGPTSVLVTSPGHSAAALYYTDGAYADLERLVSQQTETVPTPASLGQGVQGYNVTWLIHDEYIWRTDRVYVDGDEVYVETTMVGGIVDASADDTTTWHRVTGNAGEQLVGLLRGLLRGDKSAVAESAEPAPATSAPPAAAPPASAPQPEPAWFALTGWTWALPGLALGALGGVLVARRRGGTSLAAEPRRVLVDGDSVAV